MFLKLSFVVVLMTFGHLIDAQVPFPGHCPEVKLMSEFDLDRYMGIWHEYRKYPFIFEIGKKCIFAKYENLGNKTISVINASINRLTDQPSNISGHAAVLGPGQLAVVFRSGQSETDPNYIILGTDYDSWAVVYSCTNYSSIFNTRIVWILTRELQPSAEAIEAAKKVMDENKLSQTFLTDTNQEKCPPVDPSIGTNAAQEV